MNIAQDFSSDSSFFVRSLRVNPVPGRGICVPRRGTSVQGRGISVPGRGTRNTTNDSNFFAG